MLRDFRHAWRGLRHLPGFSLVTVLTLALGLGGTVTMFAAVNAAFLKPLPFPSEDRIAKIYQAGPRRSDVRVALQVVEDWRATSRSATAMAAYLSGAGVNVANAERDTTRARMARVTRSLFEVMAVAPAAGRLFTPEETSIGAPPVAIISHRLSQRLFDGNAGALSQPLLVEGQPVPIVGVMPEGFSFPDDTDFWTPLEREPATAYGSRTAHNFDVVARLAPGATFESLRRELADITDNLERQHADMAREDLGVAVLPLRSDLLGTQATMVWIGLGAVLCVLVVACANVANLMLARSISRDTETGIMVALGASRAAVIRAVIAEGLVLAAAGSALGVLLSIWGTRLVASVTPESITGGEPIALDASVLVGTLLVTAVVGIACAALPALRASRVDARDVLASGARSLARSPRAMHLLVGAEVAFAFVLLFGAGLLVRSYTLLERVDPGFRTEGVLLTRLSIGFLPSSPYETPEARRAFFERLEEAARAIPGMRRVALSALMPLGFSPNGQLFVEGRTEAAPSVHFRLVGGDYFDVLEIPIRRGRAFVREDGAAAAKVAVINEALERLVFPSGDALGQRIAMPGMDGNPIVATIVGVAADVRHRGPSQPAVPEAYFSYRQRPQRTYSMTMITESDLPEGDAIALIRDRVRTIDPLVPAEFDSLEARLAAVLEPAQFRARLLGVLAAAALGLSLVGIAGVVSYGVTRRRREIGIRAALGATPAAIARLVVRTGLAPVVAGACVGLAAAIGLSRLLDAFLSQVLFGVEARDPGTLAGVAAALVLAGLAATWWPARDAARVDPARTLRG